MTHAGFDALDVVDMLEKAGMSEPQARAIAVAVRRAHESMDFVTRADLEKLEMRMEARFAAIDAKFAAIEGKLERLFLRLVIWLGSIVFLIVNTGPILPKLLQLS